MKTIDITPTWAEWGSVYIRLAESGEATACRGLRDDLQKALRLADAAKELIASMKALADMEPSESDVATDVALRTRLCARSVLAKVGAA